MTPEPLTADRILEATEEVLRRFGPGKATVVDVARALGVSHGSVYRHFPSKAALREAVTERWLARSHAGLPAIAEDTGAPAPERLRRWLGALFAAKRAKAGDDPELFATYQVLVGEASGVVARPRAYWGGYAASKAAFEVLLECYWQEVERISNIRVAIVDPGAVRTDMRARAYPGEDPLTVKPPEEVAVRLAALLGEPFPSGHRESISEVR